MRLLVAPHRATLVGPAALLTGTAVLLGTLDACSTGGSTPSAATTTAKAPKTASASPTFDPLAGPTETAAQLPKSCTPILSDTDVTAAFGSPQVGGTTYGRYAPLPNIGRTGRVTCGFDIGIDELGRPGPAGVTVSIITYNTAQNAVSRVASNVNDTEAKGATGQTVLVNGHPATILFEPATAVPAVSASPSSPASGKPSTPAPPSPGPSAAGSGFTELLMADGNRTFVITIPMSKISGTAAANVLVNVMALVYQHTLPPTAPPSPSAPPSASPAAPKGSASPKPSAT